MPSFAVPDGAPNLLRAAFGVQAQAARAMLRYQVEFLSFAGRRAQQELKLLEDLATSEEFHDAFDVLSEFWENAAAEYAREAGRFAAIGSKLAADTARQVRAEAQATVEDMAARTAA